jgi:hypothetical protein
MKEEESLRCYPCDQQEGIKPFMGPARSQLSNGEPFQFQLNKDRRRGKLPLAVAHVLLANG